MLEPNTFAILLVPMAVLLGFEAYGWRKNHPEVEFVDWLKADNIILTICLAQILAVLLLPLGIWSALPLLGVFWYFKARKDPSVAKAWRERWQHRAIAITLLLLAHVTTGFVTPSEPTGSESWGEPVIIEPTDAAPWPASTQHTWLLPDGTILVVSHFTTPGVVMHVGKAKTVDEFARLTGIRESRLQDSAALLEGWVNPESFSLIPLHEGVTHDYAGTNLLFTHDEVAMDLFGMHPTAEMITVWRPVFGGEIQTLTIIKAGTDPFLANPGGQSYVVDWLEA